MERGAGEGEPRLMSARFKSWAIVAGLLLMACAPARAADGVSGPRDVAAMLKSYGVRPFAPSGYLVPVHLTEQTVSAPRSSVSLTSAGGERPLELGLDLALGARLAQPAAVEAPLVFIGYGLHIPRYGHDDFARRDLRGKIAVAIDGEPAALPGAVSAGARAAETWAALERAGAVGLITLPTPKSMDIPWARQVLLSSSPGLYLSEPSLRDAAGPRFTATLNPARAAAFFAASGHRYAEILALAEAGAPIEGFALNLSLKARVTTSTRSLSSPNIVGVLPGSDPRLAREHVVVSARLDQPGVATVLAVARELGALRTRPRRSVVFAIFAADRQGLGARAFAGGRRAARGSVVAGLHLDMASPQVALPGLLVPGAEESSLGQAAAAVAAVQGLSLAAAAFADRDLLVGAEPVSFARAGVPALALKLGLPSVTPEATAARFTAYVRSLAAHVADLPAAPHWEHRSLFAPPPPRAQEQLVMPLQMPVGRRPQRVRTLYGWG